LTSVDKIISFIESNFDINKQLSWDFSGRQVYLGDRSVSRICFALDPLISALEQARKRGCELLITHHPLFFHPSRGIFKGRDDAVIYAVQNNITILSYHTNLDVAANGVNAYILELLGARFISYITEEAGESWYKVVVFVPAGYENALLDALSAAGAGNIGNYSRCAFYTKGEGTFIPNAEANPFIGEAGRAEAVEEYRLEMVVPESSLSAAVKALKNAHPYEMPAFDLIPLKNPDTCGLGMVGELDNELPLKHFIDLVKQSLGVSDVRINMQRSEGVKRFSVCAGSGAELWKDAAKLGVNLHLTGDMKHHTALDARESRVTIIDIGHYHSERIYMNRFSEELKRSFDIEVFLAEETPPISTYI
jgi:dinuclear metal center YbgI/SA1388 family protein